MTVKTELASVEENDGEIRKAIERRAYELYERDGSKDGSDQEHWLRAEKELTIQDPTCSIENDEVMVRLPLEGFSGSTLLVSISARSAVVLSLEDEPVSALAVLTAISCAWFRYLSPSMRPASPANSMEATLC